MRKCELRDLGRIGWAEAYALQRDLVSRRKQGLIRGKNIGIGSIRVLAKQLSWSVHHW